MDTQQVYKIVEKKVNLKSEDIESLRSIVEEYPYFQFGIFAYLKSLYLYDNKSFGNELKKYSITIVDRKALFFYIMSEDYELFFAHPQKKEISEDKTNILLNAFFETHELEDQIELEYNLSHSTLASTDYFSYIGSIEEKKELPEETSIPQQPSVNLKHQDIIDTFICKSETEGNIIKFDLEAEEDLTQDEQRQEEVAGEDDLNDDLFFTETLAKIYTKQKKYDKAYKIIKHLSLNYPKKNIYFADQLSFLEKLIINSKYKDKK